MLRSVRRRSYCCDEPSVSALYFSAKATGASSPSEHPIAGNPMKTVSLCCAILFVCLTITSGCANRQPMCRSYNCCPPTPMCCPSPCPSPCMSPCCGGGQMPYSAGFSEGMSDGFSDGGSMQYGPSDGGMMSFPSSGGGAGCTSCGN